jgi:hypothetical protein
MGDPRSKYYWVNREVFVLERGILWRKGEEGKSTRRVVPKKFTEQVMKLCHDPSLAGIHIGRHILTYPPPIIPRLHLLDGPFDAQPGRGRDIAS